MLRTDMRRLTAQPGLLPLDDAAQRCQQLITAQSMCETLWLTLGASIVSLSSLNHVCQPAMWCCTARP